MPYNPKGYFDSLRAGTETALSMGGNAFFDIGSLGATALTDLPLWLQGFGNKSASEEFRRRKDRRRSQLPTIGVSERTQEIQQDITEPIVESAKEGWEWFSEKNPNASEALADYISDPRVQHTLESSIFAAPSLARMGKAMRGSRQSGQMMDSLTASSPSGAPGKQQGAIDFFDNSLPMDEESVMERAAAMGFLTDAYHGSTHDLTEFDADLGAPEGDWGRSVYSTTSKRDASINYAGEGADLTNRIERRAEEIAASLIDDDLEYQLEGTGISVDDFMKDEASAFEKLARMELVGDAEHGAIYPLKVNTSDYAVIGRKPTRLEEPDYWEQAKEDVDVNDYDHVEDYEDALQERMYELQADDPDHPLARVQQALAESSLWDDEMARQAVMQNLVDYDPDYGLDVSDIDQAIRDEYITAYDDMGEMISSGGISAEVLKNLGFKGVIDETVNEKFGQGRRFGGGMEGLDYDTKHVITFPGDENTIRSRYARFDPANKHKKDIRGMVDFFGGSDVDPYTRANATIAAALMGDTDIRREGFPGADINSFTSVTRPRFKQYQQDMGYYEPSIFGDTKLSTPLHQMSRMVSDYGDPLDKRIIRPEDLQGESIFPLFGDRSQTGARLWGINDNLFDSPVDLTGGYDFMRYNPGEIWASNSNKVTKLNNRIRSAHDQGQEAFGVYMPQAVGAADFNDMTLDAVRHGIAGLDLSPSVKNDFDNTVRKFRKEWTSIDDPMMAKALENNGALRKEFLKVAGQKRFAEHGFPSLEDAIYAVTDPKIMHTPLYHGGQTVGQATGKRWESGHGTYNTSMGGDYFGGFEKPIPGEIMFKDFFDKKRAEGKTGSALNRSFYLSEPNQEMTQQIVDALSEYLGY